MREGPQPRGREYALIQNLPASNECSCKRGKVEMEVSGLPQPVFDNPNSGISVTVHQREHAQSLNDSPLSLRSGSPLKR